MLSQVIAKNIGDQQTSIRGWAFWWRSVQCREITGENYCLGKNCPAKSLKKLAEEMFGANCPMNVCKDSVWSFLKYKKCLKTCFYTCVM